jgi:hypothetical protein
MATPQDERLIPRDIKTYSETGPIYSSCCSRDEAEKTFDHGTVATHLLIKCDVIAFQPKEFRVAGITTNEIRNKAYLVVLCSLWDK